MTRFLTSTVYLYFIIPLVSVFFSVFIKVVSRDDSQPTFKREDLCVGFELSLASIFAFTIDSISVAQRASIAVDTATQELLTDRLSSIPWILFGWVMGLWALTFAIRKRGWISNETVGPGGKKPSWMVGIGVPALFGLGSLIFVVRWVGN